MSSIPVRMRNRSRSPIQRWSAKPSGDKQTSENGAPKWNLSELPKFRKCFYSEHPLSASRPQNEVDAFRLRHKMSLSGSNIPRPVLSFNELSLPDYVLGVIMKNGWQTPTPIQSQGWPMALSGRDVVGIAQTGSGKTAAFLVPALVHIAAQPRLRRNEGPVCLVLVPTRELAQQVLSVAQDFTDAAGFRTICFYGGSSRVPQLKELQKGAEICIATPGRLIDFIRTEKNVLSRVTYLVLDEADRMLDMGFEPQIRKILSNIRPDRQTLMWSATWPRDVQALARDFLTDYIQVNIGSVSLHANPNITQIVEVMDDWNKEERLVQLLSTFSPARILVFVETKRKTDQVAYALKRRGFLVGAMHGDKQQRDREMTLNSFREGRINILLATDVASRGLDIDDIEYVINLDFPNQTEDYIHRIGRTARSNKRGTAYTFFTAKNMRQTKDLIEILEEAKQEVNPELYHLANYGKKGTGKNLTAFQRKNGGRPMKPPLNGGYNLRSMNPPSGFQNGSASMHKMNPSAGNLHPYPSSHYQPPFKSATPADVAYAGTHEPVMGPAQPAYNVSSNAVKDNRAAESKFQKSNSQPNFGKPGAPANPPSTESSRWDRNTNVENMSVGAHQMSMSQVPNAYGGADQCWSGFQWGDAMNQATPYWNPPLADSYTPGGQSMQRGPGTAAKRPTLIDQQANSNFMNNTNNDMLTGGMRGGVVATPQFIQPWSGYSNNYPVNPPTVPNPAVPNWGVAWGQAYGSY